MIANFYGVDMLYVFVLTNDARKGHFIYFKYDTNNLNANANSKWQYVEFYTAATWIVLQGDAQKQRRPHTAAAPCWPLLLDALCAQLPYGRLLLEVSNNILVRRIIENKRGNAPSGIGIFRRVGARTSSPGIFRQCHVGNDIECDGFTRFAYLILLSDGGCFV
jgi:hypothetical protein